MTIVEKLKKIEFDLNYPNTFEYIEKMEAEYIERFDKHKDALTDVSKKLGKVIKAGGQAQMLAEMQLYRAEIMDHFALAYMEEMKLMPSQIKLVQEFVDDTFQMYFVQKTGNIIL